MKNKKDANATYHQPFKDRVYFWAQRLKVKPNQVRIQRMTRKWASCSSGGYVTFADDIVNESKAFQDYVIVHELLHLRVPNHGKLFRSLLGAYVPDSKRFFCRHNGEEQNAILKRT
jgi:predicted metal-dependent hydrolase